ncbi:homoserine dehydrogenase [Candidatus Nanopelagicus abundans]|jgi:homoserine dehydrogenase|uniref:Homoserine dehydrogenase n=1 Tax=Candidatus Nanopelagicus abundans TaxID=1884916 RepID=A0A249L592_9ACTN|nr:homoserine dehydrogenase [Candidatus Nanopelagicus abundans]ASY24187.1 homoserine dehydrogenase [Candidatus Nanopelagicus abundans]
MKTLKVGMLGAGVVGSQIARLLIANKSDLASRAGANLELVSIAVKDSKLKRDGIPAALLTNDAKSIVNDPQIDLVIEVIGGIDPAKELILTALKNGKSVVTANKALLAKHGAELYAAADKANVDLYYEAAVAGAIPILRPLRESLVGDHVIRVMGIVNGTTNYILTKMDENGAAFADALKEAQALGFAESDPSADIEGFDAAAKAAILAGLAFHSRVTDNDVYREGISKITAADVKVAKAMEMVIKLLAIAELTPEGAVSVRVHPALISRTHPLASVRDSFNAVFVEAESAGQMMFYGKGAGGAPTASAILGDLVAVARHKVNGGIGPKESDYADLKIAQIGQTKTRYLIRLNVADKPGVLESVAHVFASHQVSIQTVRQTGAGDKAELIVMTHSSNESSLSATVKDLKNLPVVTDVASVLRVEGVN